MANLQETIANKVDEYKKVDKAIKMSSSEKIINRGGKKKNGSVGWGGMGGGGVDIKKNQFKQISSCKIIITRDLNQIIKKKRLN